MAEINDGGPAFPGEQGHTPEGTWNQTWAPGMSWIDYMAGQALVGIGNWCPPGLEPSMTGGSPWDHDNIRRLRAEYAYAQAEAMLAERERRMKEAGNG